MNRGPTHIWLKLATVAPLLALVVSLPSQALVRCHMDGQLRAACCCPADDAAPAPAGPTATAADCCDRVVLPRHHQPSEQARASQQDVEHAAAVAFVEPVVGWSPGGRDGEPAFLGRGPPGAGVGLVLLKHAFLI